MNQIEKKERFCGYCNEWLPTMTVAEFIEHLGMCEKIAMQWYKRCKEPPKNS